MRSSAATSVNPSLSYYTLLEKRRIQIGAIAFSSLSLALSIVTIHWFVRMRKRPRHKLIMLNILSSLLRALSLLFSALLTLPPHKPLISKSPLCQSTGDLLSAANALTDASILALSLHGLLQIIRPTASPATGLAPWAHTTYILCAAFAALMAGLPFAVFRPGPAFVAADAFCGLPVRPRCVTLALV
ncbi:hypothetical protein EJ06DRAFT_231690 [Trichodelitschia bisporula]|uniref:Glucose receptor Git3-like N-terminal domain-containing protein n=1 Tax=Trichodelitschia bisporula TaxID=703511 RepID=A0A6G1HLF1_9PEZI|nr:hypothetical protein EJ06DRAFT_231690 [Trichodelitschia bisporula]